MIRALLITILSILFSAGHVNAQVNYDEMSVEEARAALKEFLTDDLVSASKPLNNSIDYISKNYSEQDLKALIKNYEIITRKSANQQGKEYIPYDRRIDVDNPEQVKRFLRNRIDMIF